jgi:hypothetical protein
MSQFIDINSVSLKSFENFKLGELSSGSVPGVQIVDRKEISFDDIFFENDGTNIVRREKAKEEAVRALKDDFECRGWCVGQPLPCVIANDGTEIGERGRKKYRLIQGHHRVSAMVKLGINKFVFNIISAQKQGRYSKQSLINLYSLKSNVSHLVQTKATKYDVAKVIADGISDGTFINSDGVDEDAIRETISMSPEYISFTKSKGALTEIIRLACQETGRTDFVIRTNVEFKRALKDDGDPLYDKLGKGEWHLFDSSDPTRGFGWLISQYANSGRKQKIVININDFQLVTIEDLMKKRLAILNAIDNCYNDAMRAYGKNITPKNKIYEIVGFSASTNAELNSAEDSGKHVIPVKEAIKINATKATQTIIKVGKPVSKNKMNSILNIED